MDIEIPAPEGAKILVLTFPDDMPAKQVNDQALHVRALVREAAKNNGWPVVLFVAQGCSAHWLEAETPAVPSPDPQNPVSPRSIP